MTKKEVAHILNSLRTGTISWSGRSNCLKKARKAVFVRKGKKGQEIFKFHWQCAHCKSWFKNEADVQVDHIVEIGGFKGCWNTVIGRMFDQENLQVLCVTCHLNKTNSFLNARSRYVRKNPKS